jgi:hypothetical protein
MVMLSTSLKVSGKHPPSESSGPERYALLESNNGSAKHEQESAESNAAIIIAPHVVPDSEPSCLVQQVNQEVVEEDEEDEEESVSICQNDTDERVVLDSRLATDKDMQPMQVVNLLVLSVRRYSRQHSKQVVPDASRELGGDVESSGVMSEDRAQQDPSTLLCTGDGVLPVIG